MAVKIGAILEKIFKKTGIDTTLEEIKPLLAIETEVADEYASKIGGLLTIEQAKTNPDVHRALQLSVLKSIDGRVDDIIKDTGIQPGDDFVAEKNTYEKLTMLSKLLMEAGKKKAEFVGKEGVQEQLKKQGDAFALKEAEYQLDLKKRDDSIKQLNDGFANKETEFKNTRESDLTEFDLVKKLLPKDYVFPKEMDSSLKVNTAAGAIKQKLAKLGLALKRNEVGSLVIVDKDGMPGFNERHDKIEVDSFIDGVLAENKLLKINDDSHSSSNGAGAFRSNDGGGKNKNAAILNEIDQQINALA